MRPRSWLNIDLFIYFFLISLQDGLRKEQETAFKAWLYTMGIFTCWKWVAWGFGFIVNDMIFIYNIIMTFAWFFFNILNVLSFLCVYSLYLELNKLTKLQDMARLKVSHIFITIHSVKLRAVDWSTTYGTIHILRQHLEGGRGGQKMPVFAYS